MFSAKIEKFLTLLLNKSTVSYTDKIVTLPKGIEQFQIYRSTPDFTIIDKDRQLFPAKPKPQKIYLSNPEIISRNIARVEKRIQEQDTVKKWEEHAMSQLNLRDKVDLSALFFEIIKDGNESQVAVNVIFNIIKASYANENLTLEIDSEIQTDNEVKNISIWKMTIKKKVH